MKGRIEQATVVPLLFGLIRIVEDLNWIGTSVALGR